MSKHGVVIRFEGVEEWQNQQGNVNQILEEETGTSEYPATKSLPPIIIGAELTENAIAKLEELDGVVVNVTEE